MQAMHPFFARAILLLALFGATAPCRAAEPAKPDQADIAYRAGDALDAYQQERCRLDLYLPESEKPFPTLVWFHGGGLEAGNKGDAFTAEIARSLADEGLAVAAPNYRLSPRVAYPAYLEDAAAAAAWVRANIADYGGDPRRVFVGGHSAGGYLTLMLALDGRYLQAAGTSPAAFAGFFPVSGQTVTHFTVRKERGIGRQTIVADEAAPVYHIRKDAPPMLIVAADRDMTARAEENQLLYANLKGAGAEHVSILVAADRDHSSVAGGIQNAADPVRKALLAFVAEHRAPE